MRRIGTIWHSIAEDRRVWFQSIRLSSIAGILLIVLYARPATMVPFGYSGYFDAVVGDTILILLFVMPAIIAYRAQRFNFFYGLVPYLMVMPWYALSLILRLFHSIYIVPYFITPPMWSVFNETKVVLPFFLIVGLVVAGLTRFVKFEILKQAPRHFFDEVEGSAMLANEGAWPPAPMSDDHHRHAE